MKISTALAMAVLTQSNICGVGANMVINEMQTAISREIPDARFLVI